MPKHCAAQAACMMSGRGNLPLICGSQARLRARRGMSEAKIQNLLKASTKALGAWGCLEGGVLKCMKGSLRQEAEALDTLPSLQSWLSIACAPSLGRTHHSC